ncbi:hypothetical protein P3G55_16340 [Leptospira sp. 96542]|nr:hypothetical protein [Leptospira sp. 96542]
MKHFLIVPIFLVFMISSVYGQANSGLAEEYAKVEDYLRNPKSNLEEKKKIFESNLYNSVKMSLSKKFADPKKTLKELKFADLQTEKVEGSYSYYVKYKNYYFTYSFPVDPETYITFPVEETVLEKPDGADLNQAAHKEDKPAK